MRPLPQEQFLWAVIQKYWRWLALPFLLIVLGVGWHLTRLTAQEHLWGWWPLPLLLATWGVVLALRQNTSRLTLLGLATLAGLSLGLGFGTQPTWPLLIVGFACMLALTDQLVSKGYRLKQQWWYGYHALLLYNIIATWWVANTSFAAGFVANYLNALLMTVPWVLVFLLRKHMPKVWLAGAVCLWLGFEYLHYNWQIAWPWLTFGNSLASTPKLVQWYEITGVFGGSLYIAAAGVLLYRWQAANRQHIGMTGPALAFAAVLILPMIISGLLYPSKAADEATVAATVSAIQPNYEPHYAKFTVSSSTQLTRFDSLLGSAPGSDLYILPETSIGGIDQSRLATTPALSLLHRERRSLLVGVSSHRRYASPNDDPALRTQLNGNGKVFYYTAHNSAVAMDADQPPAVYDKSRLVPGVEFLPYRRALFVFEPLVKSLGGTTAGLGTSDSAVVFRYASGIAAAPLICYESIYGDYVREFVAAGANLLTVPTNDGWWDNSPGHRQHLAIARLRAIENRRYVVQAANSGVSGIIDTRGELLARTDYDEVAVLTGRIRLHDDQTLYTRYGDQIGRLAAGAACLLLLSLLAKRWQRRPA